MEMSSASPFDSVREAGRPHPPLAGARMRIVARGRKRNFENRSMPSASSTSAGIHDGSAPVSNTRPLFLHPGLLTRAERLRHSHHDQQARQEGEHSDRRYRRVDA